MSTFLIEGGWLTRHARGRVFEYGADDALRFLLASVAGMDATQAGDVLAGRKRITGDSRTGIDLAADDDPADAGARAELAAQYQWAFAGVWFDRSAKVHLRPYAVVTGWGPQDILPERVQNRYHPKPAASMLLACAGGDPEAWGYFRCVHYMNDAVHDRAVLMKVPGVSTGARGPEQMVLWQPVPAPPPWWPLARSPELALAAYLAEFAGLEERGAHVENAIARAARARSHESVAAADPGPLGGNAFAAGYEPVAPGADPDPATDLIAGLLPPETPDHVRAGILRLHADAAPEPQRVTDPAAAPYAWVARDGAFWTCRGYMDHIATAGAIAAQLGMALDRWKGNAEHALGEMGWAKVGRSAADEPFAWIDATKTPADPQFRAVVRWLTVHGADPLDLQAWADRAKRPE